MILNFSIKNFAIIENSELDFTNGLNIITGETGAGKSIIIQALAILLGGRASVEHIRTGINEAILSCSIECLSNSSASDYLKNIGIEVDDNEIIIRRVLTRTGKSRSFINGNQVSSKELSELSKLLIDFHGQHDGISLLRKKTHINYLDSFLGLEDDLSNIAKLYNKIQDKLKMLKTIEKSQIDKERTIELLKYSIDEIDSAIIQPDEDNKLKNEIKIYENMENLLSSLGQLHSIFSGESGIVATLKKTKNILSKITEYDKEFIEKSNDITDIFYNLEDISGFILGKKDSYSFDPAYLDSLVERSETIEKIKRKYGGTLEAVNNHLLQCKKELDMITISTENRENILKEISQLKSSYLKKALEISIKRKDGSVIICQKVKETLQKMGMENAEFKISNKYETVSESDDNKDNYEINYIDYNDSKIRYYKNGIDNIEFIISTNKGEPLKPLAKIASGGELSRVILSLKTIVAENDEIQTMIFDEIDSGIGGKVALQVSKILKEISSKKQIICITHLPQIAASGEKNILITKEVSENRTKSMVHILNDQEKRDEIARMLSGNISQTSLTHAQELIKILSLH